MITPRVTSRGAPSWTAPLGLTLAAVVAIAAADRWLPAPSPGPMPLLALVGGLALVAALHRPLGEHGAAAGVVALPAVAAGWGGALAGVTAFGLVAAADLARALVGRRLPLGAPVRWRPRSTLGGAARTSLAAVAATAAALAVDRAFAPLAGGLAFFAVGGVALLAEDRGSGGPATAADRLPRPGEVGAAAVAAAAWGAGALLAAAPPALMVTALALVAALAAEAARQRALRADLDDQLDELGRVHGAGQRMVVGPPHIESVVERICAECANVVPFQWLCLQVLPGDGEVGASWWAGSDGVVIEVEPDLRGHPPMLPGIHRRSDWLVEERSLEVGDRPVARLALWCDPRQIEIADLALLDALLPQMAASIQQALLDREAREDRLTGAAVRRVLEKRLFEAFGRASTEGTSLAIIMCDVDRFKRVNDRFGHATGDRALAAVSAALAQHKRNVLGHEDLLARYGGEEFTLLLEGADGAAALAVAERLRLAVEELRFDHEEVPVALTVSCGVAAFPEIHVKTPSELLLLADSALYEAKRRGRNRCLLDLGRGRYRTPQGEVVTGAHRPPPPPPRFFA